MGICESFQQESQEDREKFRKCEKLLRAFGKPYIGKMTYPPENYINIYNNWQKNMDILEKIIQENETMAPKMAEKIKELRNRGENSSTPVMIGTGNSCNNPVYMYNIPIMTHCPKCGGKVDHDLENGYTTKERWDDRTESYEKVKCYDESQICDEFRWNNNVHLKDVNFYELEKYYDKEDHANKVHWTIHTLNYKTKEEGIIEMDVPRHYAIIEGQRFDFPYGLNMRSFLFYNDELFYPRPSLADMNNGNALPSKLQMCFCVENDKLQIGQSLGVYGYAWRHEVYLFNCNSCGHKYHIIRTSPFAWARN